MYTEDSVSEELNFLSNNPKFECPYGYAWFLRLVIDYERWCSLFPNSSQSKREILRPLATLVSSRLIEYLREPVNSHIKTCEYKNSSWAVVQLHSYYEFTGDNTNLEEVNLLEQQRRNQMEDSKDLSFSYDYNSGEFFSVYGNYLHCLGQTSKNQLKETIKNTTIKDEDILPINLLKSVHHLGTNWSRAWALKSICKVANEGDKERFQMAYEKHIKAGFEVHDMIQKAGTFGKYSSYDAYDHWVPQFIVYSLT